jgi:SAM-dependent methyltransferase
MPDPYEHDALYYDLIHRQDPGDVGLWLSFAGRTDRPVLEVGTGTGRIALALARAGHEVTGIDPSRAMLDRARTKAEETAIDVTFIEGRVTDLVLDHEDFGFIVIPADVFLYCADGEQQLATLKGVHEALHFAGVVALDLPGPASWLDPDTNGQALLVFSDTLEDGSMFDAWHLHEDDLASQTRMLRVTYETTAVDGFVRRRMSDHLLRYVYPFELGYLLRLSGLAQADIYGDYELGPLTNESERMVVLARRSSG